MKKTILISLALFLISCGPSREERQDIAQLTCNIMGESRNMDGALRIKEINAAREKLGEAIFLGSDETIKESFEYGLCTNLVLNENYDQLKNEIDQEDQELRLAKKARLAEEARLAKEARLAEEARLAKEARLAEIRRRVSLDRCIDNNRRSLNHDQLEDALLDQYITDINKSLIDLEVRGSFRKESYNLYIQDYKKTIRIELTSPYAGRYMAKKRYILNVLEEIFSVKGVQANKTAGWNPSSMAYEQEWIHVPTTSLVIRLSMTKHQLKLRVKEFNEEFIIADKERAKSVCTNKVSTN